MGRTSIPCSDETRDELAKNKPEDMTWDAYLIALANEQEVERKEIQKNSTADLEDEINRLRRELDEFKHQMPGKVAEELR